MAIRNGWPFFYSKVKQNGTKICVYQKFAVPLRAEIVFVYEEEASFCRCAMHL